MQSTQTGLHLSCIIFRYLCNSSFLVTHPVFISFQCFSCGYKKITDIMFKQFFSIFLLSSLLSSTLQFIYISLIYILILSIPSNILAPLCSSSSLWGPLLRAVWCYPLPGVARLLQRLPELWVGHWGRAGKLHQDQLWQVCMTLLQQLSCGNKDIHSHTCPRCEFTHILYMWTNTEAVPLEMEDYEVEMESQRRWNAVLDLLSKNVKSLK